MAKRSNGFDKDPERARLAGRKSSNKLSAEVKFMRAQTTNDIETCVYKHLYKSLAELKSIYTNPSLPYLELIIIRTLIKGLEMGDFSHIESVLARSIGKIAERVDVNAKVASYGELSINADDMTIEEITRRYFEKLKEVN